MSVPHALQGAEALRNLFGGMKKKADSLARANNASLLDEDEYITGEEGLALEETERKRKLAKVRALCGTAFGVSCHFLDNAGVIS